VTIGQEQAGAQESAVTAIDVALEPDETMIGRAQAANATLLQNFPKSPFEKWLNAVCGRDSS
jgi:hypothetical protein